MRYSKKLFAFLLVCFSILGLNSCIIAALAVGGGSVAYVEGKYSMNVSNNYKDVYQAALKAVNSNNAYVLISKSVSKDGTSSNAEIEGATKVDSTNFTIEINYLTDKASKISIKFGTFGDETMSSTLMNEIQKNLN